MKKSLLLVFVVLILFGCSKKETKVSLNDISKAEVFATGEGLVVDTNNTVLNFIDSTKKIVKSKNLSNTNNKNSIKIDKIVDVYKNQNNFFVYCIAYLPNTTLINKEMILMYDKNGDNQVLIYEKEHIEALAAKSIYDVSFDDNNMYIVLKDYENITNFYDNTSQIIVTKLDLSVLNNSASSEKKEANKVLSTEKISENKISYPSAIRYIPEYETLFYNNALGEAYSSRDNIDYFLEIFEKVKNFDMVGLNIFAYVPLNTSKLYVEDNSIDDNVNPIDINVNETKIVCVDSITNAIYTYDKETFQKETYIKGNDIKEENAVEENLPNEKYAKYFNEMLHNVLDNTMFNANNVYKLPNDLEEYGDYNTLIAPFVKNVKDSSGYYRVIVANELANEYEIIYDSEYQYLIGEKCRKNCLSGNSLILVK